MAIYPKDHKKVVKKIYINRITIKNATSTTAVELFSVLF